MKIEITCPECGFNSYRALNTKTNQEVTVTISKCDEGGCNVDIIDDIKVQESKALLRNTLNNKLDRVNRYAKDIYKSISYQTE